MSDVSALTAAIERGGRATATAVTQVAIDEGLDPRTILGGMTATIEYVARRDTRRRAPAEAVGQHNRVVWGGRPCPPH